MCLRKTALIQRLDFPSFSRMVIEPSHDVTRFVRGKPVQVAALGGILASQTIG